MLDNYAELTVRVGLNVQPGQTVVIGGPAAVSIAAADFVRRLARKAYDAGAGRVEVIWQDPQITRLKYERDSAEALKAAPTHMGRWLEELAEQGAAFATVNAPDPDLLKGVDPKRITEAQRTAMQAFNGVRQYTATGRSSWVVVAVPTEAWAAKVFPDLPAEKAMARLWEYVLKATRAGTPDPVAAWQEHLVKLKERTDALNRRRFRRLHFRAPGTDLTVDLSDRHAWVSCGGTATTQGIPFAPNIPSEEAFTAPLRGGVNGTVRSTMPLNYGGSLIDGITMRFEQGRVVEYSATSGCEALKGILETDEGARYLGEVALVSVDSPVYQLGSLFYNTLFDENAACHLALGRAYPICVEGGAAMSAEELAAHGVNDSLTHVDFMIGSPEMDIDGETVAGEVVPVFRKGRWVLA